MKKASKWPLLLICLCLLLPAASARSAAVMYLDETGYPTFYERADAYDPVSALSLLASPPSEAEAGKKLTSAVLPGTKLIGMHQDGGTTVVNFSKEVVGAGLDEVRLEAVYEQVRGTLWQFGIPGEVRVLAEGTALSQFVPAPAPVQPSAQALADGKDRVVTTSGLSGRKITVSPGHGKRWNGSSWATARPVYCSPLNQEDYHNLELCQYLETYLAQDGTTVKMVRCTNKSYGASPWAGGDDWWHMGASYWLQHVGYPCSVYGPAGCNLGEGGSDDTNEIQSRPLSSDYDNSDIYISMHTNGSAGDCFGTGCPTGTCTYYDAGTEHAAWGAVSQSLATNVNNSMIDAIRTKYPDAGWSNRGVLNSDGGFGEIRIPDRAAILIELAFHDSCDTDAVKLRDNFFRSTTMWAVYKGVCDYFGTTPTWAYYSNELVSHDIPANMTVGERYTVHVTMRNRGVLWNDAKGFHLGAVDDSDPCTTTTRQPISGEVGPNSTYTFTFVLRAPLSTGTYTTDWRMVRDGFQWFGPVASQTINVTGTPDTQAPTVPTGLSAAAQDEMHVNLTWNASTDDRGVIGYYIYRNNVKIGTSATTSYSDGGCVPSTTYTYEVSAYDDFFNESGRSDPAQATTPVPSPPTVPQNLRGTGSTTSSISLAWDASTDNIGVVGYRVYRNGAQVGTTAGTTYTDTGLNYTTSYTYQVDAYDGVPSYSAKSASVVLSTQTPSYYTWTRSTSNADCYIRSGAPDATGDNTAVQCGWSSTTTIAARRGLVRWDMTGAPAQSAVVNAAGSVRVKLYCYLRSSNTARNIDLRKVTADWNEGSATWNNMAANYSTTFATCSVGAVGDYTWSWNGYTGGLPEQNRGVQVYNQAETENLMAKIFNDMENYGAVGIYPRLEIDYYDVVAPTNCTISINAGAAYTASRSVTLTLSASDFPSGMSQMQFSSDGTSYSTPEAYATTKSYTLPAGDGLKTVYVKYKDVSGNWSAAVSDTITLDTSPPTGELTINDGDTYAFSSSVTLAVSFTDAVEMRFNNENGAWSAWQAYAPTKSWSLSAGEGAKTVYAQLRDAAGNVSTDTISDGITVVGAGGTISQAKALSDGQAVVLLGKTVVANFGGTIYVEEADGSSGIRVEASGPAVGNSADVAGVIQTNANGERYVAGATVSAGGAAAMPFVPLLRTSALGGGALNAYTIGVTGGISVNNIGLLVSVAGKITRDDAGFAYVDDGSLVQDGSGWIGVRVDKTGLTAAFTEGKQCVITGVSSILKQGEAYIPVLRPRNDADAVIYP